MYRPGGSLGSEDPPRSSVDQIFDGLDDSQIQCLLEDFNNTVDENVKVSRGIQFFEHPQPKPTPPPYEIGPMRRQRRSTFLSSSSGEASISHHAPGPRRNDRITSAPQAALSPKSSRKQSSRRTYRRISRPVAVPGLLALSAAYPFPSAAAAAASTPSLASSRSASSLLHMSSFESDRSYDGQDEDLAFAVFGRTARHPPGNMANISEAFESIRW